MCGCEKRGRMGQEKEKRIGKETMTTTRRELTAISRRQPSETNKKSPCRRSGGKKRRGERLRELENEEGGRVREESEAT